MPEYRPIIQNLPVNSPYHLAILRLDLVDAQISGNKWFKLKHNLQLARDKNITTSVTFGGAFSNHIAATAAAAKQYGFHALGIIRGEEDHSRNPTLAKAREDGMQLHFVSRELYAKKNEADFKTWLEEKFGQHYLVPEGGNNAAGALGCMEIPDKSWNYDYVCCACGTATTYAGMLAGLNNSAKLIGISVLRGENTLPGEALKLLAEIYPERKYTIGGNEALLQPVITQHLISNTYCFSGYAKYDAELVAFKRDFEIKNDLPLDHVYTTKLVYAVTDLMNSRKFQPGARILVVHSGGLQGNKGFEQRYQPKLIL